MRGRDRILDAIFYLLSGAFGAAGVTLRCAANPPNSRLSGQNKTEKGQFRISEALQPSKPE